jgi:ribosomal protein S18 acetylase RimI-like enzyme
MAVKAITQIDDDLLSQIGEVIAAAVDRGEAIGLVGPIRPAEYRAYLVGLLDQVARGDAGLMAAVDDGRVVGTAQWTRSAYRTRTVFGEMDRVVVPPEHRGRGIAKQLVAAVAADAREHGIELLGLEVRGNNHGAIALYEVCGFRRTGKWENAVAVGPDRYDVILMARELFRPPGLRLNGEAA